MDYRVECHSGWKYGERPKALILENKRLEITAVQKCWRTPTGIFFQVLTGDGDSFELVYDDNKDQWKVSAL